MKLLTRGFGPLKNQAGLKVSTMSYADRLFSYIINAPPKKKKNIITAIMKEYTIWICSRRYTFCMRIQKILTNICIGTGRYIKQLESECSTVGSRGVFVT